MDVNCTPNTPYTKPAAPAAVTASDEKWYLKVNKEQTLAREGKTETTFTVIPCKTNEECTPTGQICATWSYGDGSSTMMCTQNEDCTKSYTNAQGKIEIDCNAKALFINTFASFMLLSYLL